MTDALEAAERALAVAEPEADAAEAVVQSERSALARFAASELHQPTLVENAVVRLRVVRGGRVGWAATNRLSAEGLADLARRAAEAADSAPPAADFAGLAEPAPLPEIEGYDTTTAELPAEEQARLARAALAESGGFGLYGYATSAVTALAVATSTGVRAAQRSTDATVLVLAADDGASGYAEATSWKMGEIDPAAVAREAGEKAGRTRDPRPLEPGSYRAVLEPYAFADLVDTFAFETFNGLALNEGRSFLCGRLGERLFDEKLSLADDPLDPRGLPKSVDFEGTPKRRVELVTDGVARDVVWDRATARQAGDGHQSTGHALPPEYRMYGAFPVSLSVAPGRASLDELVGEIGDGIYVTRLHYLGLVDPPEGILTGMTRDGTFRIRDGAVAEPLPNLRFTVSVPQALAELPALGRELVLVNRSDFYGDRYPSAALVPAVATARFAITGAGSGPGL